MKFYIMHRGLFEEIPASERKNHATFFAARDRRNLRRVKFFFGKYAADTRPSRIGKILDSFAGKLRIKVGGPAVFFGRPVDIAKIGSSAWGQGGDYYLETEITAGKLYCYSWIANYPDKDAICISFEILKEGKKKK